MDVVITYDGTSAKKSECRLIKGDFYKIGDPKVKDSGQCYRLFNKSRNKKMYYRINTGLIEWDWAKEEYVLLENFTDRLYGIVKEDGTKGYFTPSKYDVVVVRNLCPILTGRGAARNSEILCINEKVAQKYSDFQSSTDGFFYKLDDITYSRTNIKESEKYHNNTDHKYYYGKELYAGMGEYYNLSDSGGIKEKITKSFHNFDLQPSQAAQVIHKLLGGHSFGYEEETESGRLQANLLFKYGIVPLRDGSIKGHEFTSIPYDDAKGVEAYLQAFNYYKKFCLVSQNNSLHYHFGNVFSDISDNEEFKKQFIALYMLYYYVQKEIWDIFPPYKKSNDYFKTKRDYKDHCKDLKSLRLTDNSIYSSGTLDKKELDRCFNDIFRLVNDGSPMDVNYNLSTRRHIKSGRNKWEINSRYHALNLFNVLFSDSRTVEFRAAPGTVNIDKALPWLLITNAILHFAKKNTRAIIEAKTKYSLNDIIIGYQDNFGNSKVSQDKLDFIIEYLLSFIDDRKEKFTYAYMDNDIYSDEFKADNVFYFKYKDKSLIDFLNE